MAEIRSSRTITGYSFAEWTRQRETYVMSDTSSGELLAVALAHRFLGGWTELAVLYVLEKHRGRGYGKTMLRIVIEHLSNRPERRILMFFCQQPTPMLAEQMGFKVFADEREFARGSLARGVFIRFLYKVQWLINGYRRAEVRRKTIELGLQFKFMVGSIENTRRPNLSKGTQN